MSLYGGVELPDRPDPENCRKLDLLPLPAIRRMERFGLRIDKDHFRALSSRLSARMLDLRADILNEIPPESLERFMEVSGGFGDDEQDDGGEVADVLFNVESSAKIADLLYDVLGLHLTAGVKVKKTKGGARLGTGKKTLEQLKREHPVVPLVLEYRESSKLKSTYADALPRRARFHPKGHDCPQCGRHHWSDEWRVHTRLLTTRTPARLASKDPNLQNIPARSALGREIRAGFIASIGHVIAQRDFAQIELRLGADRSGDSDMLRVFRADGDIHVDTAVRTFNLPLDQIDPLAHRAPCKNVNFAVFYGITDEGLLDLMADTYSKSGVSMPVWMDKAWCAGFIEKWFQLYPGIRQYLDNEESKARRFGIVWTACGRVRRIPEVRSYHPYVQSAGVRQGCNHGIQGFSADIMKLAMAEVEDRMVMLERDYGIASAPLLSIHDELLIECTEDDGDLLQALLGEILSSVLFDRQTGKNLCRVPIKSDGKLMTRWVK